MKKYNGAGIILPEVSLTVCLFLCARLLSPALAVKAQESGRAEAVGTLKASQQTICFRSFHARFARVWHNPGSREV